jgi:phosphocarrier protein
MTELRYVIKDELGIHARPAGLLVKKLAEFPCEIRIGTPNKMVDGKRIMAVMSLGLKCGDEMLLTFDGPQEEAANTEAELFLKSHL